LNARFSNFVLLTCLLLEVMWNCIPLIRRRSDGRYLWSRRHNDTDDNNDDDDGDDNDVYDNVSAAKRQSASRQSRVTSSCDVITPPSSISDVDDDAIHTAAVVCPGSRCTSTFCTEETVVTFSNIYVVLCKKRRITLSMTTLTKSVRVTFALMQPK